jgi:hypothetical protein
VRSHRFWAGSMPACKKPVKVSLRPAALDQKTEHSPARLIAPLENEGMTSKSPEDKSISSHFFLAERGQERTGRRVKPARVLSAPPRTNSERRSASWADSRSGRRSLNVELTKIRIRLTVAHYSRRNAGTAHAPAPRPKQSSRPNRDQRAVNPKWV